MLVVGVCVVVGGGGWGGAGRRGFFPLAVIPLFFLPLWEKAPYKLKYSRKQGNQPTK